MNSLIIPLESSQKDVLILSLGITLVILLGVVGWLIQSLLTEKKRQKMPVLLLKANLDPLAMGLYLVNIGEIPAKDAVIQDMEVMIESAISGTVTLKFEPVKLLPARQEERLQFKVFSGAYPIAHVTQENVVPHLTGSPIEAKMTYANIQNIRFAAILQKDKNTMMFIVKEITALA